MKRENVYEIVVHNDDDVKYVYEWLNAQSSNLFAYTDAKFVATLRWMKTEDEMLYSYAAAKFQHLLQL